MPSRHELENVVSSFIRWLATYGETSYDFQTFYASPVGRAAKQLYYKNRYLGTLAVAPIIFCEAFVPSARRLFFIRQRFPIADAHFAMGFAYLFRATGDEAHYRRAVRFLEVLLETRCPSPTGYGWGYPFDWEGIEGTMKQGTPLITTLPYVYEAFSQVHGIDGHPRWFAVMRQIAEHALHDFRDFETSPGAATCAYSPNAGDLGLVVNASAYRASLLTRAAIELEDERYLQPAMRNMRFLIEAQNPDGSWFYSVDGKRPFIDHFHTCFVLKGLVKVHRLAPTQECWECIERGIRYYVSHLFDDSGLPRPFAKAPRLTVYRRELYDYAESINLMTLLRGRFGELDRLWTGLIGDVMSRWVKPDGSFRSRQLFLGWDNVPMHRWAQAQMFRSLCFRIADDAERDGVALPTTLATPAGVGS